MSKPKLHIISHTRWDREGFRTLEETRFMWVRLMDDLIDILKQQPAFVAFVLDGQAILIEDYVAVRPDQIDVVRELVSAGRLLIGPWYVLPDDLLVSPEALIRNLLIGADVSHAFGQRMDIGYLPGKYGHIGQLPQILAGFGIYYAAAHLGKRSSLTAGEWISPDGSKTLLANLSGTEIDPNAVVAGTKSVQSLLKRIDNSPNGTMLLTEGGAYAPPSHMLPDLLGNLREVSGRATISHGGFREFFRAVERNRKGSLPRLAGELLPSPRPGDTTPRSFSALIWVKQRNRHVETFIERWVEPFAAWATFLEKSETGSTDNSAPLRLDSRTRMIDRAWRILLQNHARASIGGFTDDRVSDEVSLRFNRAEQIGRQILADSLTLLANRVDTSANLQEGTQGPGILVFNAAPVSQTSTVMLRLPDELPPDHIELCDAGGAPIPWDIYPAAVGLPEANQSGTVMRFNAQEIPPMGFKVFFMRQTEAGNSEALLSDDGSSIENEYLSAEFDPFSGTLSLFDKTTGRSFSGLSHFVDGGDCGDINSYRAPEQDTLIAVPTNTPIQVERVVSPVRQTLTFLQIFRLPQKLTPSRDARLPLAAQFVPMSILTSIHLTPGVPRLDVEVALINNAMDHRLQVHFPSGISAGEVFFDGHFETKRQSLPISRGRAGSRGNVESTFTHYLRDFVTVQGGDCGLTIANQGLPEVEVTVEDHGVTLALTLLRAVEVFNVSEWRFAPTDHAANSSPSISSQCLGDFFFRYSLIPHGTDPAWAWQEARGYQATPEAVTTDRHTGILPTSASLVSTDNPAFVISAVRQSRDGSRLIVRGFNTTQDSLDCLIGVALPVQKAELLRLDETPVKELQPASQTDGFRIEVNPAQIVTIGFTIM